LQETIESNQAQLLELTEVISNLKKTLAKKQEVIDRVHTKESEFVEQIKTLKDEKFILKEKVGQKCPFPFITSILCYFQR
jgi:predicted nuclease with TOPRIM domain